MSMSHVCVYSGNIDYNVRCGLYICSGDVVEYTVLIIQMESTVISFGGIFVGIVLYEHIKSLYFVSMQCIEHFDAEQNCMIMRVYVQNDDHICMKKKLSHRSKRFMTVFVFYCK